MAIKTLNLHVKALIEVGIAVEEARVKKQAGAEDTEVDESQSASRNYNRNRFDEP